MPAKTRHLPASRGAGAAAGSYGAGCDAGRTSHGLLRLLDFRTTGLPGTQTRGTPGRAARSGGPSRRPVSSRPPRAASRLLGLAGHRLLGRLPGFPGFVGDGHLGVGSCGAGWLALRLAWLHAEVFQCDGRLSHAALTLALFAVFGLRLALAAPFEGRVGNLAGEQIHRADRVVVGWNRVVHLVWITVGVG